MQAQLKNPDARPLPLDWTEHFDTRTRQWYYINLDIVEPRATFVHPCDEPNEGLTSPMSSTTTNLSQSSSFVPRSGATSTLQEVPVNPQDIAGMPSREPVPTVAQQLYATSLGSNVTASPPPLPWCGPSASSTRTSSNSDPDETTSAGGPPAFTSLPHSRRAKRNSGTAPSPPLRPASVNSLIDFYDHPRNFFGCRRLSRGPTRFVREPQPQDVSAAASSTSPSPFAHQSIPSLSSPTASPESSGNNHRSPDVNLRLNLGKVVDSTSRVDITEQISKVALALYHPAVFSKPVSPSLPSAPIHRSHGSICSHLSSIQGFQAEHVQKPVQQPISTFDDDLSDTLRLYSAITEDEKLRVIPNPSPGSLLPTHITRDHQPTTIQAGKRRAHQFPPTINVLDVQSTSSPSCVRIQTKLDRRKTVANFHADTRQSSLALAESVVLQQPRPVRPLMTVPARFNLQVETAER